MKYIGLTLAALGILSFLNAFTLSGIQSFPYVMLGFMALPLGFITYNTFK